MGLPSRRTDWRYTANRKVTLTSTLQFNPFHAVDEISLSENFNFSINVKYKNVSSDQSGCVI
jgi:hypothetical protein